MKPNYSITINDLKYKKMKNLDISKISTFDKTNKEEYSKELENLLNQNLDTMEYRLHECFIKNNGKILDLKHLELKEFPKLPQELFNTLEELYISNNNLLELPDLDKFIKLIILDVSVNNLKKLNKLPKNLIEFCCFENELTDITSVYNCKLLKILYINKNNIIDLRFLEGHPNLEILFANYNKIEEIPKNLPKIRKIQITNNKLNKIYSYFNLIYLDCRNNNIIQLEHQENLRDLIISHNKQLKEIPIMDTLRYLEIVFTGIEKIKYMKKLQELICIKDSIKYISSKYKINKSVNHNSKFLNLFFITD